MKSAIMFLGPQGSGKGTQAKILAQREGFFYLEMGAILRGQKSRRLRNGLTVGEVMDQGLLLTDEDLWDVFSEEMSKIPPEQGVILDGIPRRMKQAQLLLELLKKENRQPITIFLDIHEEESIRRLVLRAQIEHRADDTPEAIRKRLDEYERETLPIIDFLRKETILLDIDGRPPIEDVGKTIQKDLDQILQGKTDPKNPN